MRSNYEPPDVLSVQPLAPALSDHHERKDTSLALGAVLLLGLAIGALLAVALR